MDDQKAGTEPTKTLPAGLTPDAMEAFKKKHSELQLISHGGTSLLIRQPTPGEWERFQEKVDESNRNQYRAMHELVQACTVWPDADTLTGIFTRRPAWVKRFGIALVGFAAGEEATEKNDV